MNDSNDFVIKHVAKVCSDFDANTQLLAVTEQVNNNLLSDIKSYLGTDPLPIHLLYKDDRVLAPHQRPDVLFIVNNINELPPDVLRCATVINFAHRFLQNGEVVPCF